jgi:hypothetical protein
VVALTVQSLMVAEPWLVWMVNKGGGVLLYYFEGRLTGKGAVWNEVMSIVGTLWMLRCQMFIIGSDLSSRKSA